MITFALITLASCRACTEFSAAHVIEFWTYSDSDTAASLCKLFSQINAWSVRFFSVCNFQLRIYIHIEFNTQTCILFCFSTNLILVTFRAHCFVIRIKFVIRINCGIVCFSALERSEIWMISSWQKHWYVIVWKYFTHALNYGPQSQHFSRTFCHALDLFVSCCVEGREICWGRGVVTCMNIE